VWALVSTFIDIAIHKREPKDVPASRFLFGLVLTCYLIAGLIYTSMLYPFSDALFGVAVAALWLFTFLGLTLWVTGKSERFLQTATAYIGVDTLLTLLQLPLPHWIKQDPGAEPSMPVLVFVWFFLSLIWSLEVFSYILSRSLQVAYWNAVLLVIFYFLVQQVVLSNLLPELAS
jgi:hypothetical protein